MPGKYTKKEILSLLNEKGITYHYQTYGAVHTMDDVDRAGVVREGVVLKNLFLKDRKGKKHFLVCVPETKYTDFKEIGEQIGEKKELRAIQNLMETLKMTAEQAMAALKVPDSEQEKYAGMLKEQQAGQVYSREPEGNGQREISIPFRHNIDSRGWIP